MPQSLIASAGKLSHLCLDEISSQPSRKGRWSRLFRTNARQDSPQSTPAISITICIKTSASGFDKRCVDFLHVSYDELAKKVLEGLDDSAVLEWSFSTGRRPNEEEIYVWSEFMRKRGWKDEGTEILERRKRGKRHGRIATTFKRCSTTSTPTREDLVREGTRAAPKSRFARQLRVPPPKSF